MKIYTKALRFSLAGALMAIPLTVIGKAAAEPVPQLIISQFKVTSGNGQFVTLYNQTDGDLNLGDFELDYTSSSNKTGAVPMSGNLPSHTYYILADDAVQLCYRGVVSAVSLGFTVTSGGLHLWQVAATDTSRVMTLQDTVSWSNKNGSLTASPLLLSTLAQVSYLRQPDSADGTQVTGPGAGSWNEVAPHSDDDPCVLYAVAASTPLPPSGGTPLTVGGEPSAIVASLENSGPGPNVPHMPAADTGLSAPRITELLPNPAGTGTDAANEFIELYNSNDAPFDLSGFTLETGLTTKHRYTFPDGTILPGRGFAAFYSADTGLSLSNTKGGADLLDPFGSVISQSDQYGTAKDGVAWALANGKWLWTSKLTPGATNVIVQAGSSKAGTKQTAVKGAATGKSSSGGGPAAGAAADGTGSSAPIHPYVLAAIAVIAVGYGAYEYRHDLANKLHQLRTNRAARRKTRTQPARW